MLSLPAPYGWNCAFRAHISIRRRCVGFDPTPIENILRHYSCHPPAIPKILECLKHSGRYDCYLQRAWFVSQAKHLKLALHREGYELLVNQVVPDPGTIWWQSLNQW